LGRLFWFGVICYPPVPWILTLFSPLPICREQATRKLPKPPLSRPDTVFVGKVTPTFDYHLLKLGPVGGIRMSP
jgi:hypothetical protein